MAKRQTRLIDKSTFDDPSDSCEAGSSEEADLIAEWDRYELVETIQKLDQQLYVLESKYKKAKEYEYMYKDLCK